jgi:hypothetical protein
MLKVFLARRAIPKGLAAWRFAERTGCDIDSSEQGRRKRITAMKTFCLINCAIVTILVSCLNLAVAEDFTSLKSQYEQSKQNLNDAYDAAVQNSLTLYSSSLVTIETQFKNNGNVDGLIEVRKEKQRFAADQDMPRTPPADLPQPIVQAQLAHFTRIQQADKTRSKNLIPIARQYLSQLDVLKKQLTSRDNNDDAQLVENEMKSVEAALAQVPAEQPASSPVIPTYNLEWQYLCEIKETDVKVGWGDFLKGEELLNSKEEKMEGRVIQHGMFAHAPSIIKYNLRPYGVQRLRGSVGLTDSGSVRFTIKTAAGKVLWQSPLATRESLKKDPDSFSFDIGNMERNANISLIADDGGNGNSNDHSVWIDVQIGRKRGR